MLAWDSLRWIIIVCGVAIIGLTAPLLIATKMPWDQFGRFLGMPLFMLAALDAYFEQMGTSPPAPGRTLIIGASALIYAVCMLPPLLRARAARKAAAPEPRHRPPPRRSRRPQP